ncbi:MAG: hypothetical protein ACI808_001496 [Paraglaciecola sp.]|jgi:hypothetical protein
MDNAKHSIGSQIKRNAVALISLTVAITSLSYNTWRNEQTETNRNQRVAAFEIIMKLGDLQNVLFHHHYDKDSEGEGNPRTGWTYVLTIRDLTRVLPTPMPDAAGNLMQTWQDNWETLQESEVSADKIMAKIEMMRDETVQLLESLD